MDWITTSTVLDNLSDPQNRDAWDRFVQRFRQPILAFVRKMGFTGHDAEDVAQDTLIAFADAYRGGSYSRSKGRLSTWLFGIAYRQALNARRQRARRARNFGVSVDEQGFWAELPDEASAADSWDAEWERSLLEQCLAKVRLEVEPSTFRAFEAIVFEKQPTEAVARSLSMSKNAVFIAKHRVMTRIRRLKEELESITPSD